MTTLKQGGVLQRAVSFIEHLDSDFSAFDWRLLISARVQKEMEQRSIATNFPSKVFFESPARRPAVRRQVIHSLNEATPDLVFTFCGPSYLKHPFPELMGIADGWVTHSSPEAYRSLSRWPNRIGLYWSSKYKLHWFRKAQTFITQTDTARLGLSERGKIPKDRINVIPNALAPWYATNTPTEIRKPEETLRIVYFAAPYSHKRHTWLPAICKGIEDLGERNYEIVITIDPLSPTAQRVDHLANKLGVADRIINMGRVPVAEGLGVYQGAHICFVPSILETFSATYLEAMATSTPIVTCDLDFARETCGKAAVYFDPTDSADAAEKILSTANQNRLCETLVQTGHQQLKRFPEASEQMAMYLKLIQQTINQLPCSPSRS